MHTGTIHLLTLAGAEQILPASPQKADESRHAGRDLPLQQRTNSGADLQQVVWTDVPVQFHLDPTTNTSLSLDTKWYRTKLYKLYFIYFSTFSRETHKVLHIEQDFKESTAYVFRCVLSVFRSSILNSCGGASPSRTSSITPSLANRFWLADLNAGQGVRPKLRYQTTKESIYNQNLKCDSDRPNGGDMTIFAMLSGAWQQVVIVKIGSQLTCLVE